MFETLRSMTTSDPMKKFPSETILKLRDSMTKRFEQLGVESIYSALGADPEILKLKEFLDFIDNIRDKLKSKQLSSDEIEKLREGFTHINNNSYIRESFIDGSSREFYLKDIFVALAQFRGGKRSSRRKSKKSKKSKKPKKKSLKRRRRTPKK